MLRRISESEAFSLLEKAALARAGKIRIDVYPHNWRVVTILEGPQAGKATAPPPNKDWRPYLTIGRHGSIHNRRNWGT